MLAIKPLLIVIGRSGIKYPLGETLTNSGKIGTVGFTCLVILKEVDEFWCGGNEVVSDI